MKIKSNLIQLAGSQGGLINTALQGGVGCASASASGGNCSAGAIGGSIGSVLGANGYSQNTAKLTGAFAGLATGGSATDVYTTSNTAETQSGVVAYSTVNVLTAPDLGGHLVDGYNQAASSKISLVTPWGANSTIEKYTGYTQTWLPGGEAAAKPVGVAVVNPNNNNIGISVTLDANGVPVRDPGALDEGGPMSEALNDVPGFNSGSVPHDMGVKAMQIYLSNQGMINPVTGVTSNQGTIVPIIGYNYYGLIGKTLSPHSPQSFEPSVKTNQ